MAACIESLCTYHFSRIDLYMVTYCVRKLDLISTPFLEGSNGSTWDALEEEKE